MDTEALRTLLSSTGLRLGYIADAVGVSPSGLSKRLTGRRAWRPVEVAALHRLLTRHRVAVPKATLADYCGLSKAA